jgi:tetratricopeptide (TPR) repeat protein
LLCITAGTFALWACGPYFPNWILGRDDVFLNSPGGVLRFEIERLKLPADPFHALNAEDPWKQTADADAADLQKALGKGALPPEKRAEVVTHHAELRKLLHDFAFNTANAAHSDSGADTPPPSPAPLPAGTAAPAGLPGEMADYLQGAIAYHQGHLPDATAAWQRLLHRPAAERRLRSTWAAFMLGKVALKGDRKDALHWFQSTREMAAHGFDDSLGLAAASLGWEARAEYDLGHFDRALALYARQERSGDTTALSSLQLVCRAAFKKGPDALNPIARSADAREVMTAFLVSDHHGSWGPPDEPVPGEEATEPKPEPKPAVEPDAAAWLKAIKVAMIKDVSGAERLAWAAYQGGDFAAAREWAQRAPADAPMAHWVRAKLLLRDGKVGEAQKLLDEVARTLPSPAKEDLENFDPSQGAGKVATPFLAHGEDGALLLTQGHYTEALDHFLHGGFWMEGAYVSEQVLTVDELKKYVDAGWPEKPVAADPNREPGDTESIGLYAAGVNAPDLPKLTFTLRYLLGRRLVRSGRLAEARPYVPTEVRPYLDTLDKALREGHDTARPAEQRARSLFQAACITRKKGMELAGTENEPDWLALWGGNYEMSDFPHDVEIRSQNTLLKPAADEKQRTGKSRVEPEKRFHYRYQAADLAREAAALLPDGADDKARMLTTAGGWLKARDPEAAEPFLKTLVSCCAATKLGKQAQKTHNLPEAPECEMGVPGVK